jgi:hypothetical protein
MTSSPRSLFFIGLLAIVAAAATPPPSPIPPPSIAEQLERLLNRRLKPEPLPLDLPNPFVMLAKEPRDSMITQPVAIADAPPADAIEAIRPVANVDVLADAISRMHFGGVIRMKDQVQILINDTPRKEGYTFKMPWNNAQIIIRVQRISPADVVLRYLDVEATVRF